MKLNRFFYIGMIALSVSLPLVSCGDDNDEPDNPLPNETTISLPSTTAGQVAGYSVKGEKVIVLLRNILATSGRNSISPTSYSIVTSGTVISATATGTTDSPDVALIEFDSASLPLGYVDCMVNLYYSFAGGNVSKRVPLRLGMVSQEPKFALSWSQVIWGGWDDVRVDEDGSTQIHNEPDKVINPQWTEPSTLVLNMGRKFTLPDSQSLKFHSEVKLVAAVDEKNSNLKWEMSDAKWLYDGVEFATPFTFNFGADENGRTLSATYIYKVRGEMDGVVIDETQRRPIQIEIRR